MEESEDLLEDGLTDHDEIDAESGYEHRKPKAAFTPWPHVFNLVNCITGVSVLAMPFVFQQCGILLATIMIAICSVLTKYTCHFLAKAAFISSKHSYEALALTALGPAGRRLVELCLLCFLVSSIVAFLVVIGDLGPHIVADYLELEAPTQRLRTLVMVVVMLLVIFPLCLIKDLGKFSVISSFAVLFYAIFVVRMILEAVPSLWDGKWSIHVVWWRPEGFLTCLPIVCMAMSCQTQLFCVMDCIRDSTVSRVDAVVSGAINFCSAMYAGVGLFGYVAFFMRDLHGDVLVELESSFFTQLLKLAFLLSIAISIPLMLFPARIALFNLVLRPSNCELPVSNAMRFSTFHVLTFVILLFNLTIALLIPNVEFVLGLTGSLIGSLVSIVIPSILYLAVAKNKTHYSVSYAKVYFSDRGYVVHEHYLWFLRICLVAGLFLWCGSTWATLHADRSVNVAEKPMPKIGPIDKPVLKTLQKLEEKVLDTNLNISAKLDNIADLAAIGKDKEAAHLLVEMKEERKKQEDLIRKQEQIVQELNKHVEEHEKANKKSEEKAKKGVEEIKKDVEPGLEKAPKIKREDTMAKKEEETTETNKGVKKTEKGVDEKELRKEKEFMGPEKDEVKEFAKEEFKEPMGKEIVERKEKPQENDKFMKEKVKNFEAQGEEKKINLMEEKNAQIHMEEPREIKGVKVVNPDASMKTSKNGTDVVNGMESVKEKMKENIEVKSVKVVNPDGSMKTSKNGTDVANGVESVKEKVKENIETVLEFRSSNSSWSHIKSGKESAAHIDV
ncbi:transmembrane amino acid transporter protein [Necator americanus]|uniref:Transmembrane amino acid transporter protein n=1 Tax=Necator americanus TaxID=51031 RepID=W2TWI4_NECAM|nr:transmembrane amino acid transporter protein [Necator americanus]ETN86213.1 transmembrane amino acid transporter protein [Necator americanus]